MVVKSDDKNLPMVNIKIHCAFEKHARTCTPVYVDAAANGIPLRVLIDTSAGTSTLSEFLAERLKLRFELFPKKCPKLSLASVSDAFQTSDTYYTNITLKSLDRSFSYKMFILCNMRYDYIILRNEI